jgi:hypothetical protein
MRYRARGGSIRRLQHDINMAECVGGDPIPCAAQAATHTGHVVGMHLISHTGHVVSMHLISHTGHVVGMHLISHTGHVVGMHLISHTGHVVGMHLISPLPCFKSSNSINAINLMSKKRKERGCLLQPVWLLAMLCREWAPPLTRQHAVLPGGLVEAPAGLSAVSGGQGQGWTPGVLMSKSPQVGLESGTQHTCGTPRPCGVHQ